MLQVILLQVSSLRIFLPSLKISKNAFSCRTFVFQVLQVKGRWFYEPGSKRPHHSIPSNLPLTSEPRDMFCFPKLHFHLFSLSTKPFLRTSSVKVNIAQFCIVCIYFYMHHLSALLIYVLEFLFKWKSIFGSKQLLTIGPT